MIDQVSPQTHPGPGLNFAWQAFLPNADGELTQIDVGRLNGINTNPMLLNIYAELNPGAPLIHQEVLDIPFVNLFEWNPIVLRTPVPVQAGLGILQGVGAAADQATDKERVGPAGEPGRGVRSLTRLPRTVFLSSAGHARIVRRARRFGKRARQEPAKVHPTHRAGRPGSVSVLAGPMENAAAGNYNGRSSGPRPAV